MTALELLAPAKDKTIGIAAIDCGADAVYIAGPDFGNRKAAGNSFEDIAELCEYAHRFGARVFLTVNVVIYDGELEEVHRQMLAAQEAGVDAFIFRDERLLGFSDIHTPMHASTQCSIRTVERAKHFDALGCERIILERELTLDQIREICSAVSCQVEFFVHGALCVCYSGDCRLSEVINGRSADRGECIQACRSLYDLTDGDGRVLLRNKALLSLKDYNLRGRLGDLASAGVCSFKIEGRLKNESYVRNVVRDYDIALNELVARYPDLYRRASWGRVSGGFTPDSNKTFNRGYTELWLDGKRGQWSSMDAPKSMGEYVGEVLSVQCRNRQMNVQLRLASASAKGSRTPVVLANGDGFAFTNPRGEVVGFRGDVCQGSIISARQVDGLKPGTRVFRNISAAFEKEISSNSPRREIAATMDVRLHGKFNIDITATSEDGRTVICPFKADLDVAENRERSEAMLREQLSKRSGGYSFEVRSISVETPGGVMPLLSASTINSIRRLVAEDLGSVRQRAAGALGGSSSDVSAGLGAVSGCQEAAGVPAVEMAVSGAAQLQPVGFVQLQPAVNNGLPGELMRTRYCVRYELGICPKYQNGRPPRQLFLLNNGRRLALNFDCAACEMTVTEA